MVVRNLDIICVAASPAKAQSELVIDADRVLPGAITLQCFKPVARRHSKIIEADSVLQHEQFASRRSDQV